MVGVQPLGRIENYRDYKDFGCPPIETWVHYMCIVKISVWNSLYLFSFFISRPGLVMVLSQVVLMKNSENVEHRQQMNFPLGSTWPRALGSQIRSWSILICFWGPSVYTGLNSFAENLVSHGVLQSQNRSLCRVLWFVHKTLRTTFAKVFECPIIIRPI